MTSLPSLLAAIDPRSPGDTIGGGISIHLSTIDVVLAVVYLIGIVAIGLFAAWHHKKKQGAADEYFLAGNSLSWASIGLALFATNISTLHLVSLAQNGFDTGLLNGNFEWMAGFTLVLLGLFFAPFYIRAGVSTLPDFLERRYNRICRDVLAFVSILMSTVSGALNSISTLVSYDIVRRIRPSINDVTLVRVGRIAAGVALVVAVALVPALNLFESIFNGMASIISHIAPPITCVLVLGVFWRGASSIAAATTLIGGSLLGIAVFAINTFHPTGVLNQIPGGFMMMAFTLFAICVVAQVAMSLVWPDTPQASVAGVPRGAELAWETPLAALKIVSGRGLSDPRVSSACLIAVMVGLYWWFR